MGSMAVFLVVTFLVLRASLSARSNTCHNIPGQVDFNVHKILGDWYEYERFPVFFEQDFICTGSSFSLDTKSKLEIAMKVFLTNDESYIFVSGYGVQDPEEPAKFNVTISDSIQTMPYIFLATDYEQYALIWACLSFSTDSQDVAWILTRKRGVLDPAIEKRLLQVLLKYNVDPSPFFNVTQTDCLA